MRYIIFVALCGLAAVVVLRNLPYKKRLDPISTAPPPALNLELGPGNRLERFEPIEVTSTISVPDARGLPDDCSVIGIVGDGRSRAYVTALLTYPNHVCNDLIGDKAIAVTYCDRTKCARVLVRDPEQQIRLAGWSGTEMVLFTNGAYWGHSDDKIPASDYQYELTTWQDWRTRHPKTDVYVGNATSVEGIRHEAKAMLGL